MSHLRLGLVCNEYPPGPHGGIGSSTQVLARGLARAGHRVRVIGMYPADYPAPGEEEDQGVEVRRLWRPASRFDWPAARYRLFQAVARWARHNEVDLVEVPDWQGWAAGWPRLPIPVVVRLNGSIAYFAEELGRKAQRTAYWLEWSSLHRADFWCSTSQYTADKTQRLFALRAGPHAILYSLVDPEETGRFGSRSPHEVVFTGTLTAKKGIVSLIRAWPRVKEACPAAVLHVLGKDGQADGRGSMRTYLQSQLPANVAKSVQFHGHVGREQVQASLRRARVAVFPSYVEAFANAPLEAMACGCPTIYSRRGSGPELMEDGRHGLLVEPDRPAEIAAAIVRVLADEALARRLGEAGNIRVRTQFSPASVIPANEAFYHRCVDSFHPVRRPLGT